MSAKKSVVAGLVVAVALTVAGVAVISRGSAAPPQDKAEQPAARPPAQADAKGEGALTPVEAKYVCMINNQRFNKEQIAVEVGGRTYYGCCAMCKDKLSGDPKSRVATDPVSGKEVDKAMAVIGVDGDGDAFYFESAENLKRYKGPAKP